MSAEAARHTPSPKRNRTGARHAATFVLIAVIALASAALVFTGCKSQVPDQAAAETEPALSQPQAQEGRQEQAEPTEPLTLTLSTLYSVCETEPSGLAKRGRQYHDDEGNSHVEYIDVGWTDPQLTPVGWQATGGTPPYELTIDGERRDGWGQYEGAEGWAQVSCALEIGETFFQQDDPQSEFLQRWHRTEPRFDSGLKTVRAVVTDATGATAEASIDVFVILKVHGSGTPLTAGGTYRINGRLFTIPEDVSGMIGGYEESAGGEGSFDIILIGIGHQAIVGFGLDTGQPKRPRVELFDASKAKGAEVSSLRAKLQELIDSVGRQPSGTGD